jgi:lysophospholipase L1-like esterase
MATLENAKGIIRNQLLGLAAAISAAVSLLPTPMALAGSFVTFPGAQDLQPISRAQNQTWLKRHNDILAKAAKGQHDVLLLGDSITQGWELNRVAWEHEMQGLPTQKVLNAGISSDRIEHILWRVENGLFASAKPKVCVLMAGINNLALATPETIAGGIAKLIDAIKQRSPQTKVLVLGVLPSGQEADHPRRSKIKSINDLLAKVAISSGSEFLDTGSRFLGPDGTLPETVSFDGVHLTRQGYEIWASALKRPLRKMSRS